mgnify:CR=1 FL=1
MIQYWIQVPIENAKETINRFLADNSLVLTSYDTYQADYTFETEAVKFNLINGLNYDFNTIYFGEVVVGSTDTDLSLAVSDNITSVLTLSSNTTPIASGTYPYVIFNEVASKPVSNSYFVGYKFTIAAIEPDISFLMKIGRAHV